MKRIKKSAIFKILKASRKGAKKVFSVFSKLFKKAFKKTLRFSKKYQKRITKTLALAKSLAPSVSAAVVIFALLISPLSVIGSSFSYSIVMTSTTFTNNGMTVTISGPVDVINYLGVQDDQWVRVDWGDGSTPEILQAKTLIGYLADTHNFTIHPFTRQHTYAIEGAYAITTKVYHSTQSGNDGGQNVQGDTFTIETENTLARCTDGLDNDHDNSVDFADSDCAAFIPPTLDPIGDKSIDELALLTFTATASDPASDPLTFSLGASAPAGASIDPGTGVFTWTPTEAQGPGSYPITVVVADTGGNTDSEIVTVTVNEINTDPVLDSIGNQAVDEGSLLQFTVSASDSDLPAQLLSFSASNLPAWATFDTLTRTFSGTPTFSDAGPYPTVHFEVSDGITTDSEDIDITVNNVNQAPILDTIDNKTGAELIPLTFTITGSDPDGDAVSFNASGLPAGATFVGADFSWTPTALQAGNYSVTFSISDGSLTTEQVVPIDIGNVNQTPDLAPIGASTIDEEVPFTFTASATDADVPADTLTYSLSGTVPAGASIDSSTGVFTWTPTEAQGPGSYTFNVVVFDGTSSDSETVTLDVNEINVAPVATDDAATTPEDTQVTIPLATLLANDTDADIPPNTPTILSVQNAASGTASISGTDVLFDPAPDFNGTATFEYTLSDGALTDTGLVSVDVTQVNDAPTITLSGANPLVLNAGSTFVDPGAVGSDIEDGATLPSPVVTGTASTTLVGDYILTYTVTDSGGLSVSTTRTVVITLAPVENTQTLCSDGTDNDGDGAIDLADSDCVAFVPPPVPSSGSTRGGGGGCGAGFTWNPSTTSCVPTAPQGQVLGATISAASTTGQVLGASCAPVITQYLRLGAKKNDPAQVTQLQQFLIDHGFATFTPTGHFGSQTRAAVNAFQKAYAPDILLPWGITEPTGLVYLTTTRMINMLSCPDLALPMPELIPWSWSIKLNIQ